MFKLYNFGLLRTLAHNAREARAAFNLTDDCLCFRVLNLATSEEQRVFADSAEEAVRFCAGFEDTASFGQWGVYVGDWGTLYTPRGDE
jgi:hypothetical protein